MYNNTIILRRADSTTRYIMFDNQQLIILFEQEIQKQQYILNKLRTLLLRSVQSYASRMLRVVFNVKQ